MAPPAAAPVRPATAEPPPAEARSRREPASAPAERLQELPSPDAVPSRAAAPPETQVPAASPALPEQSQPPSPAAGPLPSLSSFEPTAPGAADPSASPSPQVPALGPQLAEAVARFPDRPVELTLSPEELGRVRLTLSTSDAGLVLTVSAERPETLDLMRRNIDQLARDFREIGFSDLSFSFTQQDRRPQADPQAVLSPDPVPPGPAPAASPVAPAPHRPAALGGLDLRI